MYRPNWRDEFGYPIHFHNAKYRPPSLTPGYFINTDGVLTFQSIAGGSAESVTAVKTFNLPSGISEPAYTQAGSSTPASSIPASGLVFYDDFSAVRSRALTGQPLSTQGTVTRTTVNGIPCARFSDYGYYTYDILDLPSGTDPCTMSVWAKLDSSSADYIALGYGYFNVQGAARALALSANTKFVGAAWGRDVLSDADAVVHTDWNHLCAVFTGTSIAIYLNGVFLKEESRTYSTYANSSCTLNIGDVYGSHSYFSAGYIAAPRIYNRALTSTEITALASEFTPTTA